jgi:hypothetical protein
MVSHQAPGEQLKAADRFALPQNGQKALAILGFLKQISSIDAPEHDMKYTRLTLTPCGSRHNHHPA